MRWWAPLTVSEEPAPEGRQKPALGASELLQQWRLGEEAAVGSRKDDISVSYYFGDHALRRLRRSAGSSSTEPELGHVAELELRYCCAADLTGLVGLVSGRLELELGVVRPGELAGKSSAGPAEGSAESAAVAVAAATPEVVSVVAAQRFVQLGWRRSEQLLSLR